MLEGRAAGTPRFILIIVLASLLIKAMTMFWLGSFIEPADWEYGDIAENIAHGIGFSRTNEFSHNVEATSSHAPIYPFYLSVFYRLGQTPGVFIIIILIQILISSLTILVCYQIARTLFNKQTASLTAIALAFYPPLVYYSIKITPTVFFILSGISIWGTLIYLYSIRKKRQRVKRVKKPQTIIHYDLPEINYEKLDTVTSEDKRFIESMGIRMMDLHGHEDLLGLMSDRANGVPINDLMSKICSNVIL